MSPKKPLVALLLFISLSGCVTLPTGPSVTMAPRSGKSFDVFRLEFEKCTQLAERKLGNYYDYGSTQEAQYHYDNVYMQCMLSYENVTVAPVIRWYRISPPPPRPADQAQPADY